MDTYKGETVPDDFGSLMVDMMVETGLGTAPTMDIDDDEMVGARGMDMMVDVGANGMMDDQLNDQVVKKVSAELQSAGTRLIQRCPKSPWCQGAAEHSLKFLKRVIHTKHYHTLFQWERFLEEAM